MIDIFEAVYDSVKEIKEDKGSSIRIDGYKLDVLKQYCNILNILCDKFDAEKVCVEVEIDYAKIEIYVPDMTFEASDNVFTDLVERSNSFSIQNAGSDLICITFVFPPVF